MKPFIVIDGETIKSFLTALLLLIGASPALAGPYIAAKIGVNSPGSSAFPDQVSSVTVAAEPRTRRIATDITSGLAYGGAVGYTFLEGNRFQPRIEFETLRVNRDTDIVDTIDQIRGTPPLFHDTKSQIVNSKTTLNSSVTYYFVNGFVDYYWMGERDLNLYLGGGIDLGGEATHASIGMFFKPVEDSSFGVDLQFRYVFDDLADSKLFSFGLRYEF